ncbi:MAG: TIGR00266 family protein [Candidatus Muirbacterium halophilum]|nr:TIGR00266 family protein [Candidatus Muirbacterium halophilum]MCK9477151.1 TIGR00266 family protein [Candidatus Muirbacterium halophilum]
MEYKIHGDNLQFVEIILNNGEEIYAEAGKMFFKTDNINMQSKMTGSGIGDKLLGALKRKVTGESLMTTHFTVKNGNVGTVAFSGDYPGRIEAIDITNMAFLAQKDAFICAELNVDLSIAFQKKIGAGLFGGEGFILQKFSGEGRVFIHAGGDFYVKNLGPSEKIQVDTGSVVGFEETVDYNIEFVGKVSTAIFGGEGLFLTTLTGPGKVILQSMTLSKLRRELGLMANKSGGQSNGIVDSVVGSIFGGSND